MLFTGALYTSSLSAQTGWAKLQGGANVDETLGITSDESGSVYMTGYFSTAATVNGQNLSVAGLTDIYVSKVSSTGTMEWTVAAGGPQSDRGLGVAVDAQGNVFVCGLFTGTAQFGGGVSIASEGGSQDAFVAKYNASGQIQWARSGGSPSGADRANAVAVDIDGNVVITGQYSGTANFGGTTLTGTGSTGDVFVVKYDPDGEVLWAKSSSSEALNVGAAITTDNANNIFVSGPFSGDITFDNPYSNNILNAFFLVKYDADGNETWVRWAGGGNQSAAYGIASDGSNVYVTGDCGSTLTFFGGTTNAQINATYDNGVFVAGFGGNGQFLWGASQSSTSPVSSRAISCRGDQISIGGWHACTFTSLSDHYGEAYFNSIGFHDAHIMRYNTSGTFVGARNFGSRNDDEVTGITLPPDGKDVVVGKFSGRLILPKSGAVDGLSNIFQTPNFGTTQCGDAHYGDFGEMTGAGNLDGFAAKVLDYERSPYDFYKRHGGGCNTDIPHACIISGSPDLPVTACPEEIIDCPPLTLSAIHHTGVFQQSGQFQASPTGYDYTVSWSPNGTQGLLEYVSESGTYSATFSSVDGCYVTTAEVDVVVNEVPPVPLMSDSEGMNDEALSTVAVYLCPGETVDLWGDFPEGYDFQWFGPGIGAGQQNQEVVTIGQAGIHALSITNEAGCTSSNFINVIFILEPPEEIQPYYHFVNAVNDTIHVCDGKLFSVMVMDSLTGEQVESPPFSWSWSVSPNYTLSVGGSLLNSTPPASGWYTFSTEISVSASKCFEEVEYSVTDSIYLHLMPKPEVYVELSGPAMTCSGDTLTLYLDYQGDLGLSFEPIADFGDSLWVTGGGWYQATVDSIDAVNGCNNFASSGINIGSATSPTIFSDPPSAVVCPGDSVLLSTNDVGTITWQGPDGAVSGGQNLYVNTSGLYFAEVEFYPGCGLVSNTIQVSEYNTPSLAGSAGFLCEGDSVEISVSSTSIENLVWLPPLSGSSESQFVSEPGIYMAEITSCGITTQVSIEVEMSADSLFIEQADTADKCVGDSILVLATPGYSEYLWVPGGGMGDSIHIFENTALYATALSEVGCLMTSNELMVTFVENPPPPEFEFERVCEGMEFQLTIPGGAFQAIFLDGFGGDTLGVMSEVFVPALDMDTVFYVFLGSEVCHGPADSVLISPKPYPPKPIPASNAPVCTGTYISFSVLNDSAGVEYAWTAPEGEVFYGSEVDYFAPTMDEGGWYSLHANLEGCRSDTVLLEVDLLETLWVELPPDTTVCLQDGFEIIIGDGFAEYLWQDGSADSVFMASESGEYNVLATDWNGCKSFATIRLNMKDCDVFIPNVITINGDGLNDVWWIQVDDPRYFEVVVYNRWGTVMYESLNHLRPWDGRNQNTGELCSEGVYYYIVKLRNYEGVYGEHTGPLTLIRE